MQEGLSPLRTVDLIQMALNSLLLMENIRTLTMHILSLESMLHNKKEMKSNPLHF
jgi:hypothetical protein